MDVFLKRNSIMNDSLCIERFQNVTTDAAYVNCSQWLYRGDPTVWKNLGLVSILKIFVYTVTVFGGLIGNISVILTVVLIKSMRTTFNFYIVNLAVADMMICLFVMPYIPQMMAKIYVVGEFICKLYSSLRTTCLISSVLTLSVISCDRFKAVRFPFHARFIQQRQSVKLAIVWIASIFASTPHMIVGKLAVIQWGEDFAETVCYEEWPLQWYYDELQEDCQSYSALRVTYYVLLCTVLFFLPVLIMITAYSLIVWQLRKTEVPGEQIKANDNGQSEWDISNRKRYTMIFVVLIVFIICWTPFQALVLHLAFRPSSAAQLKGFRHFKFFSRYIAYANSFLNPIIYAGLNKEFKDGILTVLQYLNLREIYRKRGVIPRPAGNRPKKLNGVKKCC